MVIPKEKKDYGGQGFSRSVKKRPVALLISNDPLALPMSNDV
jgi:hypothetical protein